MIKLHMGDVRTLTCMAEEDADKRPDLVPEESIIVGTA